MLLRFGKLSLVFGFAVLAAALLYQIHLGVRLGEVRARFATSNRYILDRHGLVLDEVPGASPLRRLGWVSLDETTPEFRDAVVEAEDPWFHYHIGWSFFRQTITAQVVNKIYGPSHPWWWRPVQALALEIQWRKREILEAYINLVRYRPQLQGVGAASHALFDRPPVRLTRPQAAVLAALIRAPEGTLVNVRPRACELLARLGYSEDCARMSREQLMYIEQGLSLRPFLRLAPQVAQTLVADPSLGAPTAIQSTLDRELQWAAMAGLHQQNVDRGAVVVMENETGHVLAYVGHAGPPSRAGGIDFAREPHPAGALLIPFLYASALDERVLTAATELGDGISARTALAGSLSEPAVRSLELLGVEAFVGALSQLGLSTLGPAQFYGPSLALGTAEVRLTELTNAYRALANGGFWSPYKLALAALSTVPTKRVYTEEAAYIVSDVLSDRLASATHLAPEAQLATPYWTAVKTSVSQDGRERWCLGYSAKYTIGVWAGGGGDEPLAPGAASDLWLALMNRLHAKDSSEAPAPPRRLVRQTVAAASVNGLIEEVFIDGTQPSEAPRLKAETGAHSRITYPRPSALISVPPSYSAREHRIFIQVSEPRPDQHLFLNGRRLGSAKTFQPWDPERGRFVLELKDAYGRVLDKVRFRVATDARLKPRRVSGTY